MQTRRRFFPRHSRLNSRSRRIRRSASATSVRTAITKCSRSTLTNRPRYCPASILAFPGEHDELVFRRTSSYNGLEVDVNHRFSSGFQLRGVYTYSKSLDDGTAWNSSVASNAPGFVMVPLDPMRDYGPSTTDVRNLAVITGTYDLPFHRNRLVGGWSISAIGTFQSGLPFTPQLGFNPTGNGDTRNPIRPSVNLDLAAR